MYNLGFLVSTVASILLALRGRVVTGALSEYRIPRFSDVPPIEVVLLDRTDLPPAGG